MLGDFRFLNIKHFFEEMCTSVSHFAFRSSILGNVRFPPVAFNGVHQGRDRTIFLQTMQQLNSTTESYKTELRLICSSFKPQINHKPALDLYSLSKRINTFMERNLTSRNQFECHEVTFSLWGISLEYIHLKLSEPQSQSNQWTAGRERWSNWWFKFEVSTTFAHHKGKNIV